MVTKAVRGAIKVEDNRAMLIQEASIRLMKELITRNSIAEKDVVSIIFSVTKDLTRLNPATALRSIGFYEIPLFCVQEAFIEGQHAGIIRVLLTFNADEEKTPQPVYLNGAEVLRPDLTA
ncbi:Chorismate mutase AroH [subsurface metagenome]